MRQDFHSVANELRAVFANFLAVARVFVRKFLRGSEGEGLLFFDGLASAHDFEDAKHGVHRIDGGRARVFQRLKNGFNVRGKLLEVASAKGASALGESVGGGGADGSRAADNHVFDGEGGFAEVARGNDFKFVWEQALFDQQDGVLFGVEGDGAIVTGLAADGDVNLEEKRDAPHA
jgi:hypothetical protein